jgi:hypothetical protein
MIAYDQTLRIMFAATLAVSVLRYARPPLLSAISPAAAAIRRGSRLRSRRFLPSSGASRAMSSAAIASAEISGHAT